MQAERIKAHTFHSSDNIFLIATIVIDFYNPEFKSILVGLISILERNNQFTQ